MVAQRILGVILLLCLCGPGLGDAATYVVAPGGSDSNPGTDAQPFQSIARGIGVLTAGDTLSLRAGTYNESIRWTSYAIPSGTSWSNPITIRGYPGDAAPTLHGNIDIYAPGVDKYLVFSHFNIDATGGPTPATFTTTNRVRYEGMTVRYYASPQGYAGMAGNCNYCEFLAIDVAPSNPNPSADPTNTRAHGFYLGGHDTVVDQVSSHDNPGYGLQMENDDDNTAVYNNIVRNSRFYHNGGSSNPGGVTINQGDNNLVANNLIYDNINGGNGIDFNYSSVGNQAINNTIYNNAGSAIGLQNGGGRGVHDVVLANNVFYGNAGTITNSGVTATVSNNLCESGGAGCTGTVTRETLLQQIAAMGAGTDGALPRAPLPAAPPPAAAKPPRVQAAAFS